MTCIPYLEPGPFLQERHEVTSKAGSDQAVLLYNYFPGERYFGYFLNGLPTLVIKDTELIHRISVKDFIHFEDNGFKHVFGFLVTQNLFNLKGKTWRSLRAKLSPTFTSGKLKRMFNQLDKSCEHLVQTLGESCGEPLDTKKITSRYVLEVIASIAFGLDLSKNAQSAEFVQNSTSLYATGYQMTLIQILGMVSYKLVNLLGLSMYKREVEHYFQNLTKQTKEYRRKNKIERDDYFQLLLALQEEEESGKTLLAKWDNEDDSLINKANGLPQQAKGSKLLTDECITAQAFGFLTGGSDSVATTLMWALYHIAKDPAIQARAVQEAESCLSQNGGWTFQTVKDMVYLDMVIQETLRLYPASPLSLKECTVPYRLPGSDAILEKGTIVLIPVTGLHMDPEIYPDPRKFDPERFADNNYKPSATYRPFGDGPRICLAMRLAIMEIKVCLARVLTQFSVSVDKKTQEPFALDPMSFPPNPVGGVWLRFHEKKVTL
ncbi:cytochrome P450 6k1-like isoform X2 [Homalodisca vitripennis]|uniref:cytochrome P450 6k1-like isoform X2 n=1 Tax=Homalodisca vitripennis TaxID=197043 RepID=UPI001EEA61B3|nr:cytochrome P450 6k1-like isoform X2 [Homalodisca vitripennis]